MIQMLFQHPQDVVIGTGLLLVLWWVVGYERGSWQGGKTLVATGVTSGR